MHKGKAQEKQLTSKLEIYNITSGTREVIYEEKDHFEAPNWSTDGSYLIFNQNGLLYKLPLQNPKKIHIPTGQADRCNNDHGISPDGRTLAISNNDKIEGVSGGTSRIYTLPVEGGTPKLITPDYPSYWHGWSPDGKYLVYTARRNGDYDIYRIPAVGGEETRLTTAPGLDDGPEYSPDGKYIYYNSMESGKMEIWRMSPDGSQKEQLTNDSYSNWFAHPSPTREHFVYIAYLEDQGDRHPPMKEVALRLFDLKTKNIQTLCTFTGGQGTINVPSWSPDGERFAFVSYEEN
ncbi:TolB family protein [Poritiphilus flavus]|nr:transporter [Poritiphilus flavus]